MTISEMVGDLPCPSALFEAPNLRRFEMVFSTLPSLVVDSPSLMDVMEALLYDGDYKAKWPRIPIEPGNMMFIIFGGCTKYTSLVLN